MRTIPTALAAHLAGDATTLCQAWRVTRRDGVILGFTEHDHDLTFAGTTFYAASGFAASSSEAGAGLSAETSEVAGGFSSAAIDEADLIDGRYDGARVELFWVNWAAPAQHLLLKIQEIGEVTRAAGAFHAELRSLAHRLGRDQGRIYGRRCDATLGDQRCGVDLTTAARRGSGTVLAVIDATRLQLSGLEDFAPGFFRYGVLHFTSGALAGRRVDIDGHARRAGSSEVTCWLPLEQRPSVGDAFAITAGCDKSFACCRTKFDNAVNFQGFPHVPGSDFAYSYVDGETVHDGRALFE